MRREVFRPPTSALIFLLPFVSSLGSVITVGSLAIARPFAALLVVLALASATRWDRLCWAIVGLTTIWLGLGIANLRSTGNLNEWLSVALGMATILACVLFVRDHASVRLITRGWLFAWVIAVLPSVWEAATGRHLPNYLEGSPAWVRTASKDAASYFVNPNAFAYFLAAAMVFIAVGARLERGWLRAASISAAVLTPAFAYIAGARLISVVTIGILVWALWGWRQFRPLRLPVALAGALGLVAGVLALVSLPSVQLALEAQVAGSGLERFNLYRNAVWMFVTSGGVGVGAGQFPAIMLSRLVPYDTGTAINPHSGVFEILSQYGLIVAVLIAAALVAVAARGVPGFTRSFADPAEKVVVQSLLVTGITMPLVSFGNSTFLPSPIPWAQAGTLLAFVAYLRLAGRGPLPRWAVQQPDALPAHLRVLRRRLRADAYAATPVAPSTTAEAELAVALSAPRRRNASA